MVNLQNLILTEEEIFMKNPEIVRKSCRFCAKLHRISGSCVDVNIDNIYAPRQPDDTACPLFTATTHEHFPNIQLENTDD
jgi:hypothetical protein